LKIAGRTLGYGTRALEQAQQWQDPISPILAEGLVHHLDLMGRVIQQTQRRVILGQKVPATEKIVSIFEEQTDIIEKGARENLFGHKLYLSVGKSSLSWMLFCCGAIQPTASRSSPYCSINVGNTVVIPARPVSMAALLLRTISNGPKSKASGTWPLPRNVD